MDAFENLRNAIIQQAAEDYAAAFMGNGTGGKAPEDVMSECERFFRSDWYEELTGGAVDGEWLMKTIKIREVEKAVETYETIVGLCNRCTFQATVSFPHTKGREKRKPLHYIFPPRLVPGLMDMARIQLEELKLQLKELKSEDGGNRV